MSESEAVLLAIELDAHHAPETNGRMSVCRRCGGRTDSPAGAHHVLNEQQVTRSRDWLRLQERQRYIIRAESEVR